MGEDRIPTEVNGLNIPLGFDKTIHEPVRLTLLAILCSSDGADFKYLQGACGLTKGNLAAHLAKLEESGYISVTKSFIGRIPNTSYRITDAGRKAFGEYLDQVRKFQAALEGGD